MIKLEDGEQWTFNTLISAMLEAQGELNRLVTAKGSYIKLLEMKYNATFDPDTGQLKPKEKEKGEAEEAKKAREAEKKAKKEAELAAKEKARREAKEKQ